MDTDDYDAENDDGRDVDKEDAEGVWSPDIEQSFQEALAIYPPCGRRKIILSDEGKMYGRNELIARYIRLRTGKSRSRKQVSSHIQVLARKRTREIAQKLKTMNIDPQTKERAIQSMAGMSSAQIVSASSNKSCSNEDNENAGSPPGARLSSNVNNNSTHSNGYWNNSEKLDIKPFQVTNYSQMDLRRFGNHVNNTNSSLVASWDKGVLGSSKLRLLEFRAYVQKDVSSDSSVAVHSFIHLSGGPVVPHPYHFEPLDMRQIIDKFPSDSGGLKDLYTKGPQSAFFLVKFWGDLNSSLPEESNVFYAVDTICESATMMTIQCTTTVCSFGSKVVEKVETEFARPENDRFVYRIEKSEMCDFMVNFITKLRSLPERFMLTNVLENFSVLQVITEKDSGEILLCMACVFDVASPERGTTQQIYRLVYEG